jgi:hypothetical protein
MNRERSGEKRDVEINAYGVARCHRSGRNLVRRAADHGTWHDGWHGWNHVPDVTRRMDRRGSRRWPVDLAHYRPYQARELTCYSEASAGASA